MGNVFRLDRYRANVICLGMANKTTSSGGNFDPEEPEKTDGGFIPIKPEVKPVNPEMINQGLKSLENPVLRGSFTLVLDLKIMNFLDGIAKKAFKEIMANAGVAPLTSSSSEIKTIRLPDCPEASLKALPGVYVIQNTETGSCVTGQTKNLKSRFNQYTSRAKRPQPVAGDTINKSYYLDAQDVISRLGDLNRVFNRYVVYAWVDANNQPLDVENSLELKNQMNYLEHRLILAFFECGLCYNTVDVAPQLGNLVKLEPPTKPNLLGSIDSSEPAELFEKQPVGGNKETRPFKLNNMLFRSAGDYLAYQDSIGENRVNRKRLRKRLDLAGTDLKATTRYLTEAEIEEANNNNLFIKVARKSSPYKPKKF